MQDFLFPKISAGNIYVLSASLIHLIRRALLVPTDPLPVNVCTAKQLLRVLLEFHFHDLNAPLVMMGSCSDKAECAAVLRMCYDYLLFAPRLSRSDIVKLCEKVMEAKKDFYVILHMVSRQVVAVDVEPPLSVVLKSKSPKRGPSPSPPKSPQGLPKDEYRPQSSIDRSSAKSPRRIKL